MTASVALLDYGVGNTASVMRAFRRLGAEVELTADPERVARFDRIVLPGVGAFAPARERLAATGLDAALAHAVSRGARLLGLCLGFQLLFESSEEFGVTRGLGFVAGRVARFPHGVRTPHIGWNQLKRGAAGSAAEGRAALLASVPENAFVYFVHSFRAEGVDPRDVASWCDYGGGFPAAIQKGSVWGCQFHPEKSSDVGRRLLVNFLDREGG